MNELLHELAEEYREADGFVRGLMAFALVLVLALLLLVVIGTKGIILVIVLTLWAVVGGVKSILDAVTAPNDFWDN